MSGSERGMLPMADAEKRWFAQRGVQSAMIPLDPAGLRASSSVEMTGPDGLPTRETISGPSPAPSIPSPSGP